MPPSPWVRRFLPLIAPGGQILDVACGRGRHARWLASLGMEVEAVDRDDEALASMAGMGGINTRCADLEGGPWPYYGRAFDGIVVTNYLYRPLLPQIANCLGGGGVLIYETFMVGNEILGKPSNPAFLLRSGELLELARNRLTVVAYEQGRVELPRPALIQRICAVRGAPALLPLPEMPAPL